MVIGSISGMAKTSMGELAFVAVAVMAIGNAGGRILAGTLSDRIGRRWTLCLVLTLQAILMLAAIPVTASKDMAAVIIVLLAALIGANYGANLSLFPSYTKDLWGLKTFGMNYGVLFTAWGVGGFVLPRVQQMLYEASKGADGTGGSYMSSFLVASALLLVGTALTFLIKPPQPKLVAVPA
jgi:nitrate/nitrite transporter NarK